MPALPDVTFPRGNRLRMTFPAGAAHHPTLLSGIRIAAGGEVVEGR